MLKKVDYVFARTRGEVDYFKEYAKTVYIGFTSTDCCDLEVTRQRGFLHLAGNSLLRETDRLVELWARHPKWPILLVVRNRPLKMQVPANVLSYTGYLSGDHLREVQNEYLFHLCTSQAESWGHYIVEAMSVGAVVFTNDAKPMNELVSQDRGILIPCSQSGSQHLVPLVSFQADALESKIDQVLRFNMDALAPMRSNSRVWFDSNYRQFQELLRSVVHYIV